jgi:hypothetical protein
MDSTHVQYTILQLTRFTTDPDDISCLLGEIETGVNARSPPMTQQYVLGNTVAFIHRSTLFAHNPFF